MKILQASARRGALLIVLFFVPLGWWPVSATHEANHRYAVQGYVLDAQQQPRKGVSVSLSKDNRSLGQAVTNDRGFFRIDSHLHDSDIGRSLVVRVGNSRGEIRMQATRGDLSTHRMHHVNFIGDSLVEGELDGVGFLLWLYAVVGMVTVVAVAGLVVRTRKKKRKAAARQKSESKKRNKRNKNKKKKN